MNSSTYVKLTLLVTLLLAAALPDAEARGGRRGGGSLGGIFGGWRKYKKPSSGGSGSGRRTINGSPMQTTATKMANGSPSSAASPSKSASLSSSSSLKAQTQSRTQAHSYPKQPTNAAGAPPSYASLYGGTSGAHMPPGSTYYANTAAMPPGAIYYAQPPVQSTSGNGDFLFGLMAGHMLFGHRPHVTHVYHERQQQQQQPAPATSSSEARTIIIDNGGGGGTATVRHLRPGESDWPMDSRVPLAPFNATITPAEAIKPATSTDNNRYTNTNTNSNTATAQQVPTPPGGIVCVPLLFNETDPSDPTKTHNVEKVVCFPAPPPLPATPAMPPTAAASSTTPQCALRTFVESDPHDPTKTIEVQKEYCSNPAATTKLVQVAGEIGENNNSNIETNKQPTTATTLASTPAAATTPTTAGLSSTSDKPADTLTRL